jgi:hypothetical protein
MKKNVSLCSYLGGAMPIYSRKDGVGQELLLLINGRNLSEFFVGHERLRLGQADLQVEQLSFFIKPRSIFESCCQHPRPPNQKIRKPRKQTYAEQIFSKKLDNHITIFKSEVMALNKIFVKITLQMYKISKIVYFFLLLFIISPSPNLVALACAC